VVRRQERDRQEQRFPRRSLSLDHVHGAARQHVGLVEDRIFLEVE
jgi:hypothetical protein